jgi:hypothetical protein
MKIEERQKVIENYLADPKVVESLKLWAVKLQERFHNNWFTIEQIIKKFSFDKLSQVPRDLITMLTLKELIVQKQESTGKIKFKVIDNPEQRLNALKAQLVDIEAHATIIKKQILKVEVEIASLHKE